MSIVSQEMLENIDYIKYLYDVNRQSSERHGESEEDESTASTDAGDGGGVDNFNPDKVYKQDQGAPSKKNKEILNEEDDIDIDKLLEDMEKEMIEEGLLDEEDCGCDDDGDVDFGLIEDILGPDVKKKS